MSKLQDEKSLWIKIKFDGADVLRTEFGQEVIPKEFHKLIYNLTFSNEVFDRSNEFIEYCKPYNIQPYLPDNLMSKYGVGLYRLNQADDINNPWNNKRYVLFNPNYLKSIYRKNPEIENASFWVCPSFNEDGECDGMGFRIVDSSLVKDSFKWLFLSGNNMVYGKDKVDKNKTCYIVEGFRDYVALKESGYNVIGLGSVNISPIQKEYINTLKDPILLLDNDTFGLKRSLDYLGEYRIATLVGTNYKDAYDTFINGVDIKIMEIV